MSLIAEIVLLIVLIVVFFLVCADFIKMWKERKREELRRETIKNVLQDICEKLDDISKALWYEK